MVAKTAPARRSGRGSATDLRNYLVLEKDGTIREDLLASWSSGVVSTETAAQDMEATIARFEQGRTRLKSEPLVHLIASFRPGEQVDTNVAKAAQEAMLRSLGAEDFQSFSVLHYDDEKDRYHIHVMLNRVHPESGKMLDMHKDYPKLARAAEYIERQHGLQVDKRSDWRKILGERDFNHERDFELEIDSPERTREISNGEIGERTRGRSTEARDAANRSHYSWAEIMKKQVTPAINKTLESPSATWDDVNASLRLHGVRLEQSGSGYRIVGPERNQHIKLSDCGLVAKSLNERLGEFVPDHQREATFQERIDHVKRSVRSWRTWEEANKELVANDLAIAKLGGNKGRIVDLRADQKTRLAALGVTIEKLEKQLGSYQAAPEFIEREAREKLRQEAGMAERAKRFQENHSQILDGVSLTRSVWDTDDIETEIRNKLGIKGEPTDLERALILDTRTVVLAYCEPVAGTKNLWTTKAIREEEAAMFGAANVLYGRTNAPQVRAPGADLDPQQRAAYEHLATDRQIAIVSGVAGAGKSRLLRDLCDAYESAGSTVYGAAVAGEAAATLGDEAEIASFNVSQFLTDVEKRRIKLHNNDVIVIDEASTLGTEQAKTLFEHARDSGASVRLLGDLSQHESVTRGAVMRGLAEDYGAYDMENTRRSIHEKYRTVATDLRTEKIGAAFDTLIKEGDVRPYETTDEAKRFLVRRYVESVSSTVEGADKTLRQRNALLLCDTNNDMNDLNGLVQKSLVANGTLKDVQTYKTSFGKRDFYVGDVLTLRKGQKCPGHDKWLNRDRAKILRHLPDGKVLVQRERDGAKDIWDTNDTKDFHLGYAMTSYSSQGKTVDDVFILAGKGLRSLYVGVTRARDEIVLAYGHDQYRDTNALMVAAQRNEKKALVRDSQQLVPEKKRELTKEERQLLERVQNEREKLAAPQQAPEQKRERGFGIGM